ncbi:unnamed protein product, partial [Rotaria sp. Silwood1]
MTPTTSSQVQSNAASNTLRRSARNIGKMVDYRLLTSMTDENNENVDIENKSINVKNSALHQHAIEHQHKINWDEWKIITTDPNWYRLRVRESLHILEKQPELNKTVSSVPLIIYPEGLGGQKPKSIALAMAMCAAGARNETLNQMLHVFDITSIEHLAKTAENVMHIFSLVDHDTQVKLKLANRLYGQKTYKLQENYLSLVQTSFKADIKLEDFENNSAHVVQTINAWVEKQTNKLIRNLLSTNDVSRDTRLIIVNCIYFKGTWVEQFKEHLTNENADFHEADGKISKIKLMHQKEKFNYAENEDLNVQIAHLSYKSDISDVQFVFTVILPKQGISLDEVERKLTSQPNLMQQVLSDENTTIKELLLYIPKFKMEAKFELNDVLVQLGMTNAFDGNKADFTGMVSEQDDKNGLYISKVIHKAFIDVNEL